MVGLIDGSLSTLAPIFGIAFYTHRPAHRIPFAGLATFDRRRDLDGRFFGRPLRQRAS